MKQTVTVCTLHVCPNRSVLKQSNLWTAASLWEYNLNSPQSRKTLLEREIEATTAPFGGGGALMPACSFQRFVGLYPLLGLFHVSLDNAIAPYIFLWPFHPWGSLGT
jgi:hypothetical protein